MLSDWYDHRFRVHFVLCDVSLNNRIHLLRQMYFRQYFILYSTLNLIYFSPYYVLY